MRESTSFWTTSNSPLTDAVAKGLVTEAEMDRNLQRRLPRDDQAGDAGWGLAAVPWARIGFDDHPQIRGCWRLRMILCGRRRMSRLCC